jgi:hypothetical protein
LKIEQILKVVSGGGFCGSDVRIGSILSGQSYGGQQ